MGEVDAVALGGQTGVQGVGKVDLVFDHEYAHVVQLYTVPTRLPDRPVRLGQQPINEVRAR
ncbi:hypothetical protein NKH77_51965 [Streptomyces sp. M19]